MKTFTKLLTAIFAVIFIFSIQSANAQLNESFEGTFLPTGWTKTVHSGNDITQSSSQNHTTAGTKSARFSSYSGSSDYNQYLFSPQMSMSAAISQLSFWHRKYNTSQEVLEYGISTTTPTAGAVTTWIPVTLSNSQWNETTADLSAYNGQSVYICFHY